MDLKHKVYRIQRLEKPEEGIFYYASDKESEENGWAQMQRRGDSFPAFLTSFIIKALAGQDYTCEPEYDKDCPLEDDEQQALERVFEMINRHVKNRYRLDGLLKNF